MPTIDLRSDTLTKPTPGMLRAMARARVGDDNFAEDPATNELEEYCAALFGKPAAVFMPSGTMSNQVALRVHTRPGDEVVIDESYHFSTYESGPSADLAGVCLDTVRTTDGILRPEHVLAAIDAKCRDPRYSQPVLVSMENTINYRAGRVVPVEDLRRMYAFAGERGMGMHLDGARLFNAVVASGTPADAFGACTDTVSVCFAKGLGAPFGSVLAGPAELMARARYYRKSYGGAMHQSGYLAAAARYALEHHVERLAEDHHNAGILADLIAGHPLLDFARADVQSNIVIVGVARTGLTAERMTEVLRGLGVLVVPISRYQVRFVTRLGIETADVELAAKVFLNVLDGLSGEGSGDGRD